MNPEQNPATPDATKADTSSDDATRLTPPVQAPVDALSRTPDDLEQEKAEKAAESIDLDNLSKVDEKKISPLRRFLRRINVYFLIFILLVVVGGAITVVNYLNSQKEAPAPSLATQSLSEESLKQLANTDASVGNTSQTLTIQGNAVIEGQSLLRGDLNVASNLQTGGSIRAPSLTISGDTNLGATQAQSIQVQGNAAIQGDTTLSSLNVSGASSFSGAATMSQLTVTRLILSGNASLQVPNHISFNGASPGRSINAGVLGSGGSASVDGSDTAGTVNLNTGGSPASGCFVRISFNRAFTSTPHVVISPVGATAGQIPYYVTRDTTGFSICTTSPAPGQRAFAFDYFVTG